MTGHIQKWGNSLGLRIPKAIADELKLSANADVEMELKDGSLVVSPSRVRHYDLKDLLRQITPENIHNEADWGESRGRERFD